MVNRLPYVSPQSDLFGLDFSSSHVPASPVTPVKPKKPAATPQGSPSLVSSPIVSLTDRLKEFRITSDKKGLREFQVPDKKGKGKGKEKDQGGNGLQYYSKPGDLKKRLQLLLASKKAGNDSKNLVNEAMEIIDLLLENHQRSKAEHRQIFNFLRA